MSKQTVTSWPCMLLRKEEHIQSPESCTSGFLFAIVQQTLFYSLLSSARRKKQRSIHPHQTSPYIGRLNTENHRNRWFSSVLVSRDTRWVLYKFSLKLEELEKISYLCRRNLISYTIMEKLTVIMDGKPMVLDPKMMIEVNEVNPLTSNEPMYCSSVWWSVWLK